MKVSPAIFGVIGVAAYLLWLPTAYAAPKIDCKAPTTSVEHAVCSDPQLSFDETVLESTFQRAEVNAGKQEQRVITEENSWFESRNSSCGVNDLPDKRCLKSLYEIQIRSLNDEILFNYDMSHRIFSPTKPHPDSARVRFYLGFSQDDSLCKRFLEIMNGPGANEESFADAGFFNPPPPKQMPEGFSHFPNGSLSYGDVLWNGHPRYYLIDSRVEEAHGYEIIHTGIVVFRENGTPKLLHFNKQINSRNTDGNPNSNWPQISTPSVDFYVYPLDEDYFRFWLLPSDGIINIGIEGDRNPEQNDFLYHNKIYFYSVPILGIPDVENIDPKIQVYHLDSKDRIVTMCYLSRY